MSCKQTGNGTLMLARVTGSGDPYAAIGCVYAITPGGVSYGTVVAEQCLDETGAPNTELGDADASESGFTHAYCPGGAQTEMLRGWANDKLNIDWRIKYPPNINATVGILEDFRGRIRVFQPDEIGREDFMKVPITILIDGNIAVTALGAQVVDAAAVAALPFAGLSNNTGVTLDDGSVYRWLSSATAGDFEPTDKPNPGVDPGWWVLSGNV